MGAFDLASQAAVMASGALPSWGVQASFQGAPASPTAGVDLLTGSVNPTLYALAAAVSIAVRTDVSKRTAVLTVTGVDPTSTYDVTLGGHACTYNAGTGDGLLATILAGLAASIITNSVVATAVVVGSTVVITGLSEADYSITFGATGSGTLAITADAKSVSARIYVYNGQATAPVTARWRLAANGDIGSVSSRGWGQNITTASWTRLYVELYGITAVAGDSGSVAYVSYVDVAPCLTGA